MQFKGCNSVSGRNLNENVSGCCRTRATASLQASMLHDGLGFVACGLRLVDGVCEIREFEVIHL